MTKLTTERLEEIAKLEITEFSNGMDIAKDAYQSVGSSEIVLMARQLLAYEQAAKNPVAWVVGDEEIAEFKNGREVCVMRDCDDEQLDYLPLYAAPVLPKQPELIGMKVSIDTGSDNIGHRLFGEIVGTSDSNGVPVLCIEVAENNGDMAAPAQPVIPDNDDDDLIQRISGRAKFLRDKGEIKTPVLIEAAISALSAQPVSEPYKLAANDIIAERQRQISEEGWTPEHDDKYNDFQLAFAAAGYAQNVADYAGGYYQPHSCIDWTDAPEPEAWPWSPVWWKPSNPRRDLVKAGALILAEIERLDRAAPAQEGE